MRGSIVEGGRIRDLSGGQLDGERQAIKLAADLHDGWRILVREREVRVDLLRALDEQLDCLGGRSELGSRGNASADRHWQDTCMAACLPIGRRRA